MATLALSSYPAASSMLRADFKVPLRQESQRRHEQEAATTESGE